MENGGAYINPRSPVDGELEFRIDLQGHLPQLIQRTEFQLLVTTSDGLQYKSQRHSLAELHRFAEPPLR
jgi:hypothetical protein